MGLPALRASSADKPSWPRPPGPVFALVDCNNFYAACHVVMRPSLKGVPLVVLGANEGNVVARSNEARALGIKMGQPFFEIEHLQESSGLVAVAANFAYIGDMSDRVMSIAAGLGPRQYIYSVDEAFSLGLEAIRGDLAARAWAVRARILKWTGIACCVGIAPTMTLAKFANHVAKQSDRKPGSYPAELAVVCDLAHASRARVDELLAATEVGEIWGIGRKIGARLVEGGCSTALDLARMDAPLLRSMFGVVVERTALELRGVACLSPEEAPSPRKQIACTRSFGSPVEDLRQLGEAVSEFASQAAAKLRRQSSVASQVLVFIRTSPFRKAPQCSRSTVVPLRRPCADTAAIVSAALAGLRSIHQNGYLFAKAGVMLLDISPARGPGPAEQLELGLEDDEPERDRSRLMQALDAVNDKMGKGTLKVGTARIGSAPGKWTPRQDRRTPDYTTRWEDLPVVRA